MTSCKPPPTCIDASPIPDANDSRMSAIPYEANLTPMGCQVRSNSGLALGLRRCPRTGVGVKQPLPLQQDTGDPEQPVGDPAQGTAVGVTARPEGSVAAAALGVVQDGHPRPVEHSVAQPDLGGVAHRDDAALAAALGYGGHAREGSEGGVVAAADRPGSFGEQGREG